MNINTADMKMIPGDVQPNEKSRYYVWLPEGRDVGAPFREFDPIGLEPAVISRLKSPTAIYLCYDEEDASVFPQIGEIKEEINAHKEDPSRVTVDVESATLTYKGADMEGANWLVLIWR